MTDMKPSAQERLSNIGVWKHAGLIKALEHAYSDGRRDQMKESDRVVLAEAETYRLKDDMVRRDAILWLRCAMKDAYAKRTEGEG